MVFDHVIFFFDFEFHNRPSRRGGSMGLISWFLTFIYSRPELECNRAF